MSGFDNIDPEQQPNMSDDPLGGLDPMAWLESLAARQGATEGFTTAADLDIPEVDPTTAVVNEPGYTPYDLFGTSGKKKEEAAAQSAPPAEPVAPPPAPVPMAAASVTDDPLGGLDPMAWLETLAARQGATEGFTTAADLEVPEVDPTTAVVNEPGYTPYDLFGTSGKKKEDAAAQSAAAEPVAPPAPPPVIEEPPAPVYEEPAAQEPQYDWGQAQQYDPNAYQQPYDPNQYDPAAYQQYDPNAYQQPYDPNQYQQPYDPNQYDPAAYQQYDPNAYQQPYDPNQYQQPYDPNQYDPAAYQQYDPNAYQPAYQEEPAAPQPAVPSADDPLGGLDPMAWLETLAARQGADRSEFTTAADLNVAEIDPNSVTIDEPGYTPSETIRSRHVNDPKPGATVPPAAPPPAEPVPMAAAPAADDPLGGLDPMAWLETLAARQGADPNEFTTAADLEVAEVDPSTFVDTSPGYTPSETIRSRHQEPPKAAEPPPPAAPSYTPEPVSATDDFLASLSQEAGLTGLDDSSDWLNQLAQETGAQPADFLDFSTEGMDTLPGFDLDSMEQSASQAPEAIPATHTPEQLLGSLDGLSDDEIQRRAANHELSAEQEFALIYQKLQKAQTDEPEPEMAAPIEDMGPAEAGELPPWLQGVAVVDKEESSIFTQDIAGGDLGSGEVPAWLQASPDADSAFDLPDFTPEPVAPATIGAEDLPPTFLNLDHYDPAQDEWANALDEEYDRMSTDAPGEEAWFKNAMEQVAQEEDILTPGLGAPAADIAPEPLPGVAADMPDWLAGIGELDAAPSGSDELLDDLPDWLRPAATPSTTFEAANDIDTWLRQEESGAKVTATPAMPAASAPPTTGTPLPPVTAERLTPAQPGALPAWAASAAPATPTVSAPPPARPAAAPTAPAAARPAAPPPPPPARPAAVPVPPPPARTRVAVTSEPAPQPREAALVPADPAYAQFKAQLDQNPGDHAARLSLARAMRGTGDVDNSLRQYETLVDQMANLGEVSDDVLAIITQNPAHPRARRVLGDAYMRQGYLQEALDAYRGALDNL